ncbi:helix-turn-helix domain-containing protein [Streptomyces sp. NPDC047042]|uniref:helix-turn-helix domain-containing protein n=1 Tax=Streptomyces sp. NPDC047042 TaxID=3154807 RepID=UPI0033D920CD
MLSAIGLDEAHESAYRALLAAGAADVPELARRLALGEYVTERALRGLERHGLAARSPSRPGHWVAAPPGVALGALLTRQRHELERAELAAALLAEEYRARSAQPAVPDLVEVVTGAAAVSRRLAQLRLGAGGEVCALLAGKPVDVIGPEVGAEERSSAPGLDHRVVVERAVLELPTGVTGLTAALSRGARVRVVDRVPAEVVIADRSLAVVPLTSRTTEPAAFVVHAGELLDLLSALFESVWRDALPLRLGAAGGMADDDFTEGTPDRPDAADLEILSLLLAGLTDASVARQLDLGLRTVQRRVKRLMELTGVTTRLQLGWHAYERGWITRDGRP